MKIFENDKFKIEYSDSLEYIIEPIKTITNERLSYYYQLFGIDEYRKIVIHLFDNRDEFRLAVLRRRENKDSLPAYAGGTFDDGEVFHYIAPNYVVDSTLYKRAAHSISHEIWHILYQEIVYKEKEMRVVWFDEGMAQFVSKENWPLGNVDAFNIFFYRAISGIPTSLNLNEISHNNGFVTNSYDGYSLSFIAIKYLYETLSEEEFMDLISNPDRVKEIGDTVLKDAINYYGKRIENVKTSNYVDFMYSNDDKDLISQLEEYINENAMRVFDFFDGFNPKKKPLISIIGTKEKYDNIQQARRQTSETPKWEIGNSHGDVIEYVSLHDYKNTTHTYDDDKYDQALEQYKKTIIHEYVHFVLSAYTHSNGNDFPLKCLNEGIATFLSGQKDNANIEYTFSLEDILGTNNCYDGWYLITKYILETYGKDHLLKLLLDNENAKKEIINMFDDIKKHYKRL